jgi:hypothetical protein
MSQTSNLKIICQNLRIWFRDNVITFTSSSYCFDKFLQMCGELMQFIFKFIFLMLATLAT